MEINFKFAIGEFVTTKESAMINALITEKEKDRDKFMRKDHLPIAMTVIERVTVECSSGVQVFYNCFYYGPSGYCNSRFNETDLVAFETK